MNALRDDRMAPNVARILDFPGFYESLLTMGLDHAEEMTVYNIGEDHPELDESDIAAALYEHSNYGIGFDLVARAYVGWLNTFTGEITLTFESVVSPREYNFTTDALYVTVNDPAKLRELTDSAVFDAVLKEHFTSGPGFHSFYSNDVPDKPLDEWDHNELGTLLTAYLHQRADEEGVTRDDMLEWLNEDFDDAIDKQTDWAALHAALGIEP